METAGLTLRGEQSNKRVLDYLISDLSEEEMRGKISSLFGPKGNPLTMFKSDFFRDGFDGVDMWGRRAITDCLMGLPADHGVVREILREADSILGEVPRMSASGLRAAADMPASQNLQTPIVNAFYIGDVFHPDAIFGNLKPASYHTVNEHISHPKELPYGEPVTASIRGMMGYAHSHPDEALKFANFLEEEGAGTAYMLRLYLELDNKERAITSYIKALEEGREGVDFKHLGKVISKAFGEKYDLSAYARTIKDAEVKGKFMEYFGIGP